MVFIEGRIQTRNWEAKDGGKRNRTEVVVEKMQLGPRLAARGEAPQAEPKQETAKEEIDTIEYGQDEINPDEIPF